MKKNYVTFVVDASGSMAQWQRQVSNLLGDLTRSVMDNSSGQQTKIAYKFFSSPGFKANDVYQDFSANPVPPRYEYPDGWTALNDALMTTIEKHKRYKTSLLGDVAHLIVVVTDGVENMSRQFTTEQVKSEILKLNDKDNWTIAMNVPPGTEYRIHQTYGVYRGNVTEWEQSLKGITETISKNVSGTQAYMVSRAAGATKSMTFYETNLDNVSVGDLKQCDDFSSTFTSKVVPREMRIDEFVTSVTHKPYMKGTAFYQLTKPEKLQQHKQMIVRPKGSTKLYGGNKVKDLLGIPHFKDVKVTPGNHAGYDLFVQSTSDNRKLVRGSHVLVIK